MGGADELLESFKQQVWNMSVQHSRDQGAALHKPLATLCLFALMEQGMLTSNRIHFSEVEKLFRDLWPKYGGRTTPSDPALPFFHLRSEPFWSLQGVDSAASSPPALSDLRSDDVWAELVPAELFTQLQDDRESRLDVAESLLARWWPVHIGQALAEELDLARAHYICIVDPDNFEVCLRSGTWGAKSESSLRNWRPGDLLLFHVTRGAGLSAIGVATSSVHRDDSPLWQDMSGHSYPWRLAFRLVSRLPVGINTKSVLQPLRDGAPRNWFNGFIQSTHSLTREDASALVNAFNEALSG